MKVEVIQGLRVVIDPPQLWWGYRSAEEQERTLIRWAKELEEFIRDHRSQDAVAISVERDTEDQCSHCYYRWEVDEDGRPVCCDSAIEEWEADKEALSSD